MRNQEEWARKLRSRMENHQEPAPSDLWDNIDKALGNNTKAKTIPLWRWMAAACAAAVAIATWMVMGNNINDSDIMADNSVKTSASQPSNTMAAPDKNNQYTESPSNGNSTKVSHDYKLAAHATTNPEEGDNSLETQAYTTIEEHNDHHASTLTENSSVRNDGNEDKQDSMREKLLENAQDKRLIAELEENFAKDKSSGKNATSGIRLFAQNTFHSNSSSPSAMVMASNSPSVDIMAGSLAEKIESPTVLDSYRETHDYDKPVTIGLSFSYGLTDRMALTTGVAYTKLSDHTTKNDAMMTVNEKHTLYYVGIPVGVSYKLLQAGRLQAYAMAGAQADFNVKASTTVNGQKAKGEKDNIQLSLNGAMGIEYEFLPQVGLYIEPGLRYNIDNGSEVKTYFKKHDVDFNLQLGFRVNFGK